jgi:hypothetical protein
MSAQLWTKAIHSFYSWVQGPQLRGRALLVFDPFPGFAFSGFPCHRHEEKRESTIFYKLRLCPVERGVGVMLEMLLPFK